MTSKQCPCPEAQAGECCKHCPTLLVDNECKPVAPRDASFIKGEESPHYVIESADETRPRLNGGW